VISPSNLYLAFSLAGLTNIRFGTFSYDAPTYSANLLNIPCPSFGLEKENLILSLYPGATELKAANASVLYSLSLAKRRNPILYY